MGTFGRFFGFLGGFMGAAGFAYGGWTFLQAAESHEMFLVAAYAFFFGSFIFLVVAFVTLFAFAPRSLNKEQKERIRSSGVVVNARIENIEHKANIRINGRAPYIIHAVGMNPLTGQEQRFLSEWIWNDPHFKLQGIDSLTVFIDQEKPQRYFMDLSLLGL